MESKEWFEHIPVQDCNYFDIVVLANRFKKLDILNKILSISEREAKMLFAISQISLKKSGKCLEGIVKISDLAEWLQISMPACSATIRILEDKGWVVRTIDKSDRRVVFIEVTSFGMDKIKECRDILLKFVGEVRSRFGEEKITQFTVLSYEILNITSDVLEETIKRR